MNWFDYKINHASTHDIREHLHQAWGNSHSLMSSDIEMEIYIEKIRVSAYTFECWDGNVLVGLVACYLNDLKSKTGFITNVSVISDCQKKGIGYKLITNVIREATRLTFKKIKLEVWRTNEQALLLYEKSGFCISGYKEDRYEMTYWIDQKNICVSISCITYNHELYIRQCMEGFLMQKTDFNFEVLIHDDASTDDTANIIREYEQKYPDIIKPIYQIENQYSKGIIISVTYNFPRAKGKYIALCEGDDYWTDPYKLQKQIDFLEANPDFSICFHNVKIREEENNCIVDDYITRDVPDITDIYQLVEDNYIHTPSVVFRKNEDVIKELSSSKHYIMDYVLHLLNARYGKIKKIPEDMAVYRVHVNGVWSMKDNEFKIRRWILVMKGLVSFFKQYDDKVLDILKRKYAQTAYSLVTLYRRNGINQNEETDELIKDVCEISPYYFCNLMNKDLFLLEKKINKYKNNILCESVFKK
ncbi:MAG: GNAT family N-acetyltransferase [Tannerella sp.]|jgi:glycosyltransferase involved in cell wall biosynthesis/GNAT superfamily N-acetyltransferase|nr:GNAT family N-acetyltransferase [Tannerella sp.]